MRTQFSKFALAAGITLALAFTFSCSSDKDDDTGNGVPFNENSQIYNEYCSFENGDEVCYIGEAYKGNGDIIISPLMIKVGSVTNGIVNLERQLPEIPDEMLRYYIENEEILASCSAYPTGIKTSSAYFILIDSNGDSQSLGLYSEYDGGKFGEGIYYMYFSKEGKIACNSYYEDEWEGVTHKSTSIYDIDAKVGWNKIYLHEDNSVGINTSSQIEKWSTTNILTREMKWTITTTNW